MVWFAMAQCGVSTPSISSVKNFKLQGIVPPIRVSLYCFLLSMIIHVLAFNLWWYSILHEYLVFYCAEMHCKSLYISDGSAISCSFNGSTQVWCYSSSGLIMIKVDVLEKCIMHHGGIMMFAITLVFA